jgi:hypothetical protein
VDIFAARANGLALPDEWIVECKRYSPDRPVGVDVVRQLAGVKYALGSRNAALVTSSRFTQDAKRVAEQAGVDLVDRAKLIKWLLLLGSPTKSIETTNQKQFQTVFISHSHRDHDLVARLNLALRERGIRTWFSQDDLDAGTKIHEAVFEAIASFDRLIVVLSESSIRSQWVIAEMQRAMRRQREEKRDILFPVSLLPYNRLRDWTCFDADTGSDIAVELRQYLIPVLTNPESEAEFKKFVNAIVRGLSTRKNA